MIIIRQPIDNTAHGSTSSSTAADKTTELIITFLEPHTSESLPALRTIARILTGLLAGNFDHDDLCHILNNELDILAISAQAKQNIIPALLGITKVIEVQWQVWGNIVLCSATCMPILVVFINIIARPCVSHKFDPCQHCCAPTLTVEYLSTSTLYIPLIMIWLREYLQVSLLTVYLNITGIHRDSWILSDIVPSRMDWLLVNWCNALYKDDWSKS